MGKTTKTAATTATGVWTHPKEEALAFENSRAWSAYRGGGRRTFDRRVGNRGRRVGGGGSAGS